jgi:hypothetical protein
MDIPLLIIPVEVKYRISPYEIKGLMKFLRKFNADFGVVITKDMLEFRSDAAGILFIPAWLFLSIFDIQSHHSYLL